MAGEGVCFMHCPPGFARRPRDTGWFAAFGALEKARATHFAYIEAAASRDVRPPGLSPERGDDLARSPASMSRRWTIAPICRSILAPSRCTDPLSARDLIVHDLKACGRF
jgi:hypothetical protein